MPERRVLLATSEELPDLGVDERLVLPHLAAYGVDVRPAVWSDPGVDWDGAVVVVRSTWDYTSRRDELVAWAERVSRVARLFNPAAVIRANTDKRYLAALTAAGVPTVPTEWISRGATRDVGRIMRERDWPAAVVKPAVSAGARDTMRVTGESLDGAQQLADRIARSSDVLVQPYLQDVEAYGERSLVHLGGRLSHAVRKAPMLAGATSADEVTPADARDDEIRLAARALDWVRSPLLYARVDIARLADGSPVVMELELTEPRLFLRHGGAQRFAELIAAEARRP